jgi:hypothetical protein
MAVPVYVHKRAPYRGNPGSGLEAFWLASPHSARTAQVHTRVHTHHTRARAGSTGTLPE